MGNKYFTVRERYTLEVLLKYKVRVVDIARVLGKDKSTIYREIKRGTVTLLNSDLTERKEYCADAAQADYENKKLNKGVDLKIGHNYELADYIEYLIKDKKYSPYAVSQMISKNKERFGITLHYQTIYRYIDNGLFFNISNKDLTYKSNSKRKYHRVVSLNNLRGASIESRPKSVYKRDKFGHWEMDCVVGKKKGSKEVLLVLTERMTRNEIIFKLKNKTSLEVVSYIDYLEKRFGAKLFRNIFKTITVDNGTEFLDFNGIERSLYSDSLRTKVYYCHPYCSSERGSNENANKLIRRFIPKGADISDYSSDDISYIQEWINNYPRLLFKGKSSNEMLPDYYRNVFIKNHLCNFHNLT